MKLALFFLGVCLAQAALNPEELREKVFEQGKEYVYKYEGDVKSGIPQTSDKYSGMKIEAEVRLQFKTDKDVLMRLEKIKFKSLRGEMESPEERELRLLAKDPKEEKRPEQRQRHAFDQEFQKSTEFELDFDSEERLSVERTLSEEQERRDQQERNQQKKSRKSSSEQEESIWEASREVQEEVSETEKSMTELRRHLEKTVLVRYEKGNVTKIEAQKDEPQESVNIKRGIWNMLQVTMDPKNVETLDKDSKDKSKSNRAYDKSTEKLFRIMEQDVSGQCETQYDIRESRLQKNLFEVTKTKDYQNCRQKVEKLHSLLSAKKSKDESKDRKEDKLESSSVSRLLVVSDKLRSDKFLIQQSEVRSQHVFQPYSKQGGEVITFSKQTLKLKEAKQMSERMPEPLDSELKGNLSFVFEKVLPKCCSEESQRTDSEERREEKTQERKEKIERLSKEISKEMKHSVSEQAPRKFVELVKELRQLNEEQMKKILKELITKPLNQGEQRKQRLTHEQVQEKNQTRKVLLDAVSLVGKREALRAVRELMELKRLSESETELLLTGLSLSIQPCPSTTREMLEIAKSERSQESKQIRKSAWLSLGTMINGMINKQKDGQMRKRRPQDQEQLEQIKREFSRELLKGIEEEKSEEEKLIFLRAIKNAGLEQTIDRLQEIISGKDSETNTKEVRVQAIDAMSRVAKKLPNKVRQIALRVFQNPEKSESERIRAYELMMKTKPTLSFIELIAQSTQRETSNQVGQYVYTDLKSRSESKLQQDKKMSQLCKIALRLCKPFNKGIQYSESRKFQMVDEDLDMGVSLDLKSISDKKSIFPKDVRAQLRLSALGYDIELLEIAGRAEGLQSMIDSVLSKKQEEKKNVFDYMMKKTRESSEEYRKTKEQRQKNIADIETEKIQRSLPIETRRDEEPRLTYSTKWSDNEISFQQFDKEELKKMVREGKLPMSDLEEQLRKGLKHQSSKTTFLVEASRQIPTTLGLPLHLNLTSVLIVKSKSEGKLEVTPRMFREDRPREQKEVRRIESELKSNQTIVLYTTGKMTVLSRVLKSGVAINVTLNTTLPVSGKLSMDLESQKYKLTMETPEQERELVTLKSTPFVYTEQKQTRKDRSGRKEETTRRQEITIKGKKIQKTPTEYNRTFGREEFGVEFRLNSSMVSRLNKEKRSPFQPLTGPVELRLSVRPGQNKPKEVEIELEQKEVRPSSSERSEEREQQQKKDRRMEIVIRAKHDRQDREMKIKIQDSEEKFEEDPRQRQLDSREQRLPKKFLVRSIQEPEPQVSSETRESLKESQKKQTRRTIAVQIERKRLQNEREDFKACVNMEFEYPSYADYRLVQDRIQKTKIDAKWGRDCSGNDKKMTLKAKFQKSVEQRKQERKEEQMYEQAPKNSKEWLRKETEQDFESFLESLSEVWTLGERSESRSESSQERSFWDSSEKREYFSETHSDKKREVRENVFRKCLQDRRQGRTYSAACLKAIEQRSQLRELDIEIEHQNLPTWMKQLVSDLHKHTQHTFWDRTSVKDVDVRNEENKLRLRLTVDKEFKEMNVSIKTPREETNMTRISLEQPKLKINLQKVLKTELPLKMDLSIPMPLRFPSTKYSLSQEYQDRLMNKQYWPYCKVESESRKIRTFDNVEYKYELSQCDHILAKDASPEERFMVLISKKTEQKPENTLKVFLEGKKVELRSREESESRRQQEQEQKSQEWTSREEESHKHREMEITVDGRQVEVQPESQIQIRRDQNDRNSEVLFTIQRSGKMVKIISQKLGLKIKHDGHSTWVKVSNSFRSKMAGLCGNFDGEQTKEYSGPSEEIYQSHKMFALSYQVPSKQCETEGKKLPQMRNVMISRTNENGKEETCFSKTPVPQCPEGSRKTKSEKSQMEFHCLYTNLESTKKMIKLHQTKPLEKMMSKKTDRVQEIEAELECREQ
ncbi:vitellogenin-6-like isoform X1 [Branchiostoma floridae]|uniref:Vitellogenin-6-like isoform X1 n=1 Tax=Branchiostoma floridae TaxID=7739 RepID=A0A9J7MET5_BRAFL|nr:vitellogenin-6-like isoform X1 [Branchiostoma floridae]